MQVSEPMGWGWEHDRGALREPGREWGPGIDTRGKAEMMREVVIFLWNSKSTT